MTAERVKAAQPNRRLLLGWQAWKTLSALQAALKRPGSVRFSDSALWKNEEKGRGGANVLGGKPEAKEKGREHGRWDAGCENTGCILSRSQR